MMQVRPKEGLQIDGFTLGEKLHTGGFATRSGTAQYFTRSGSPRATSGNSGVV